MYNKVLVAGKKKSAAKYIESGDYNSYTSITAKINYDAKIGRNCLIKDGSLIQENTIFRNTIIEENVVVEKNCKIFNSYIRAGAKTEPGLF